MLYPKVVAASTIQVFVTAFLLSYFKVEVPLPALNLREKLSFILPQTKQSDQKTDAIEALKFASTRGEYENHEAVGSARHRKLRVFTRKELAKFDGSKHSKGLYMALLGRVYDVEKGRKHYGPEGGYHFFAGKDASKSFVTGDFTENGLVDDVTGLQPQDLIGIEEWVQFYDKEYTSIGYVQGMYYDSNGQPTIKLKEAEQLFKNARIWQKSQKADLERFPSCNSEWIQGKGGRVWCSNKSGGVSRDWVGVPRKLFTPGNGQSRCACVKDSGAPLDRSADEEEEGVSVPEEGVSVPEERGDLDSPNLRLYDNCDPKAVSCNL